MPDIFQYWALATLWCRACCCALSSDTMRTKNHKEYWPKPVCRCPKVLDHGLHIFIVHCWGKLSCSFFFWRTSLNWHFFLKNFSYFLGLLTATVSSEVFKAAQPALLYLVPFTLLPLLTMAYLKVCISNRIFIIHLFLCKNCLLLSHTGWSTSNVERTLYL